MPGQTNAACVEVVLGGCDVTENGAGVVAIIGNFVLKTILVDCVGDVVVTIFAVVVIC